MRQTSWQVSRQVLCLDPARPLSEALCDHLCGVRADGGGHQAPPFDFSRTMVLVPGGRLAHGLERELLHRARVAGHALIAPTVVTPAMLLPRFLVPQRPLLTPLGSQVAWQGTVERLFGADDLGGSAHGELARHVARILGGTALASDGSESGAVRISSALRRNIARRLARIDRELASALSSCAEVALAAGAAHERGAIPARIADAWRVLAEVEALHGDALARAGVADRDRAACEILRRSVGTGTEETANPARGEAAGESVRDGISDGGIERIVVLFADPEPVQRALLDVLESQGVRIDVCVHAVDGLDAKGFPVPAQWSTRRFPTSTLSAAWIDVVESVAEAGEAVVRAIRALPEPRNPDAIAVMAADEDLERSIDRALQLAQARAHAAGGQEFSSSRLATLLARLETLLREGSLEAFAAFVRHPDVAAKLRESHPDLLDAGKVIADYWAVTAVTRWLDDVAPCAPGAREYETLRSMVRGLLEPLLSAPGSDGASGSRRPAHAWAKPLRAVVRSLSEPSSEPAVKPAVEAPSEPAVEPAVQSSSPAECELRRTLRTVRLFDRSIAEFDGVPAGLADEIEIADLIAMLRDSLDRHIVDRAGDEAVGGVELVRWLDIGIADEPHLVLCGMHEGAVPDGGVGDALLTEELRSVARLPTGDRRVARDAWILDGLLLRASKRPGASLKLIVPRKSTDGEPLRPSRFLLRVDAGDLPARVAELFEKTHASAPLQTAAISVGDPAPASIDGAKPVIEVAEVAEVIEQLPRIEGTRITQISVTAFRQYLQCPYLFQLRQDPRLRLSSAPEGACELGSDGFGNLLHAALETWGREEAARAAPTTDGEAIEGAVLRALDRVVAERFPKSAGPAVRVQVELVRRRLRRFAALQKEQAAAGWHVRGVELRFQPEPKKRGGFQAPRFPNEQGVYLTGQIDRVDRHMTTGAWRALDYKSGADGDSPTDAHKGGDERDGRLPDGPWLDLQLPLYRTLLASLPASALGAQILIEPTNLGYVNLTPKVESSAFEFLMASEEDLLEAEAEAARIIAAVQAGVFEPAEEHPLRRGDPLGVIWGEGLRKSSRLDRVEVQDGGTS